MPRGGAGPIRSTAMNGQPERDRRWVAVLLVGALAIAIPTAAALARPGPKPAARPATAPAGASAGASASPPVGSSCAGGDAAGCARLARDAAARIPLTASQRDAALALVPEIRSAIRVSSCAAGEGSCPSDLDIDEARQRLMAAGFTDVTVHVARPDDPAPPGSVIYAVGVGPACVLLDQSSGRGPGGVQVVGKRPDGNCLAP